MHANLVSEAEQEPGFAKVETVEEAGVAAAECTSIAPQSVRPTMKLSCDGLCQTLL